MSLSPNKRDNLDHGIYVGLVIRRAKNFNPSCLEPGGGGDHHFANWWVFYFGPYGLFGREDYSGLK